MLKHIVLHGPAIDNVGGYHDAGAELEVGAEAKAGLIDGVRAQQLVDGGRAVSRTEAEAIERDSGKEISPADEIEAAGRRARK